MTENEAIKEFSENIELPCGSSISDKASKLAIKDLEEIQQYRAIGTVEECREAVERQKKKPPAIDDFNRKTCPFCGYISGYEGDYGIEYEPHCSIAGRR